MNNDGILRSLKQKIEKKNKALIEMSNESNQLKLVVWEYLQQPYGLKKNPVLLLKVFLSFPPLAQFSTSSFILWMLTNWYLANWK